MFAVLCRIIVEVCRDALWIILVTDIDIDDIPNAIANALVANKIRLFDEEKNDLIPPATIQKENCDLSVLYRIIRGICSSHVHPTLGWNRVPQACDIEVGNDIQRLQQIRNTQFGHIKKATISSNEYQKNISEIKYVMKRLDSVYHTSMEKHVGEIEHVFVEDIHQEYQAYINELKKIMEETVMELDNKVETMGCKYIIYNDYI